MKPLKTRSTRKKPETILQNGIAGMLRMKGWYVMATHGNMYQSGFPDLYATHSIYGTRWIEVKRPSGYSFTPAQLDHFPKLSAHGTRIYILTAATEEEYKKLFGPANWHMYLGVMK